MRWEKLFEEIESQSDDARLLERDAEIADHVSAQLAETSWQERLGIGPIDLIVQGHGRVMGTLVRRTGAWLLVRTEMLEFVVNPAQVSAIRAHAPHAIPLSEVEKRVTWVSAMRFLQRQHEDVHVVRADGSVSDGRIRTAGGNYVGILTQSGMNELTPYDAIAILSCQRPHVRRPD